MLTLSSWIGVSSSFLWGRVTIFPLKLVSDCGEIPWDSEHILWILKLLHTSFNTYWWSLVHFKKNTRGFIKAKTFLPKTISHIEPSWPSMRSPLLTKTIFNSLDWPKVLGIPWLLVPRAVRQREEDCGKHEVLPSIWGWAKAATLCRNGW